MEKDIIKVCRAFKIYDEFLGYKEITIGNINSTYRVYFLRPDGSKKSFVLQKLNLFVFKHPQAVMRNIDLVTEHIRAERLEGINLHYHHTITGENYYIDETGFWRMMNFIDSVSCDQCQGTDILYNAGKAFGKFQCDLQTFNANTLFETIKDFHNTPKRLEQLFEDVENAKKRNSSRVNDICEELEYIKSVKETASIIQKLHDDGELPVRVTHNDTKINNVLFEKGTGNALTVIDLDTVMPGLVAHDFGDAVRFGANFVEEDSPEFEKAGLDLEKFTSFAKGFILSTKKILTKREIDTLALSCFTLTIELAARFLADYVNDDVYFHTRYSEHNLVRARCQIALAKDILLKQDKMKEIIEGCL